MKRLLLGVTLLGLVSCGQELTKMKQDIDRELTNGRKNTEKATHDIVELPKVIVNDLLDSNDEEIAELERKNAEQDKKITQIQEEIEALRDDLRQSNAKLSLDIAELYRNFLDVNEDVTELTQHVDESHNTILEMLAELEDDISNGNSGVMQRINLINDKIRQLEDDIDMVQDNLDNLEVVCRVLTAYPFLAYCVNN